MGYSLNITNEKNDCGMSTERHKFVDHAFSLKAFYKDIKYALNI